MLFGLSGASRSGKSTVMKSVAAQLGIACHATSTAKVVEELGIDLSKPMTLRERLGVQMAIFERFILDTETIDVPTILDRTPLDMLAYTFAEFGMASHEELGEDGIEKALRYADLCREHTINNFQFVFVLRPLPFYNEEQFKPKANAAYHQHFQMTLEGALSGIHGQIDYGIVKTIDHEERVGHVSRMIQETLDSFAAEKVKAALH